MKTETIISAQNPKIRELLALQEKSRLRRELGLFVVEGRRELGHCLDAGYIPRTLFVCRDIIPAPDLEAILCKADNAIMKSKSHNREKDAAPTGQLPAEYSRKVAEGGCRHGTEEMQGGQSQHPEAMAIDIPPALYDKDAYRGGTEGIIAEMEWQERSLDSLQLGPAPLIAVLESVEKPGNLGAVLRSADAAGADAIIICDPLTDLYNPNLIRASIGAVFSTQVVTASSEETIVWLKSKGIGILTAQLQDSQWYYDTDMRGGTAIVMGTEATGLSPEWRQAADAHIKIPMLGRLDSLNVSVSAAILLYEAVRQRHNQCSGTASPLSERGGLGER